MQPPLPALQAAAGPRPAVIGRAQSVPQLGLLGAVGPQEVAAAQVDGDHQTFVTGEAFLHLLRKDEHVSGCRSCASITSDFRFHTFSCWMLTLKSRMLVAGVKLCSRSSSGSTLPSQEVTSHRSEVSFCRCWRSCWTWACSSSQRSITPEQVGEKGATWSRGQNQRSDGWRRSAQSETSCRTCAGLRLGAAAQARFLRLLVVVQDQLDSPHLVDVAAALGHQLHLDAKASHQHRRSLGYPPNQAGEAYVALLGDLCWGAGLRGGSRLVPGGRVTDRLHCGGKVERIKRRNGEGAELESLQRSGGHVLRQVS